MQVDTKVIINATRLAAKVLQRDFFELENLQSSGEGNTNFIHKSYNKAFKVIYNILAKYYKTIIFDNNTSISDNVSSHIALVKVIDGLGNFKKSLPYFSTIIVIISKKDGVISPERVVINFPILGEMYYAERGKGAWFQKFTSNITGVTRARVSGFSKINDMIILSSSINLIDKAQSITSNIRIFDSCTYSLAQVVRGKIDAMIVPSSEPIIIPGIKLLIKESGGTSGIINNILLASNFRLYDKINNLLSL